MAGKARELFLRQLLPGRDVCMKSISPVQTMVFPIARQMANLMYLIGDKKLGKCIVVDPCWDVKGIIEVATKNEMKIAATVLTHYHFDHTGGVFNGVPVEGVYDLVQSLKVPVYVNEHDSEPVRKSNGISSAHLRPTKHHDVLVLSAEGLRVESRKPSGEGALWADEDHKQWEAGKGVQMRLLHTPGHSPGSMCILVNGRDLVTGDTLFAGSCGRIDLGDSDKVAMWHSLRLLSTLPGGTVVWPGHAYGGDRSTVEREQRAGFLRSLSLEQWKKMA